MSKVVDARGQLCPMPIIMAKKALKEIEIGVVETLTDNEISKENLEKMARETGLSYETTEENGLYHVMITKTETDSIQEASEDKNDVVVIASDKMGDGSDELGKILMKGFIYTLTEMEEMPKTVLFYNAGAKLTIKGSESLEDIKVLVDKGVEILTCGTCLNFYEIQDKLAIGETSNMYTIVERQKNATKVIKP